MNPTLRGLEHSGVGCRAQRRLPVLAALIVGLSAFSGGALAFAVDCTDTDGDGYSVEGGSCGPSTATTTTRRSTPAPRRSAATASTTTATATWTSTSCFLQRGRRPLPDQRHRQCLADKTGTFCALSGPLKVSSPRVLPFREPLRRQDNDCDGLTDHAETSCQTAELCNGFDDDFDGSVDEGFLLGSPCTEGTGACERTGTLICASDGGTQCTVAAGAPGVEGPAGCLRCRDGVDNDCDSLTDLADPTCQTAEVCDGLDNGGDGAVDETSASGTRAPRASALARRPE
jgi:hypothetical protein